MPRGLPILLPLLSPAREDWIPPESRFGQQGSGAERMLRGQMDGPRSHSVRILGCWWQKTMPRGPLHLPRVHALPTSHLSWWPLLNQAFSRAPWSSFTLGRPAMLDSVAHHPIERHKFKHPRSQLELQTTLAPANAF